ncbi:MAG: antitoxin family protein [Armatimonadota bacterium]|nr:antitoxin family protein [Armatimonadota bacterium]
MTTVEAIYENGVLRLLEPLELDEGTRVEVVVIPDGVAQPDVTEPQQKDQRTPAEILAEIAALSVDHGRVETASVDHDKILYGDVYRKYGA